MTAEFMLFANIVLIGRMICLFRDQLSRARTWIIKTVLELAALLVLFELSAGSVGAALASVACNLLGWGLEQRGYKHVARLALGLCQLGLLSFCFAHRLGVALRPLFASAGDGLEQYTVLAPLLLHTASAGLQLRLFGLLLAANEANLLLRALFDWLDLKPRRRAAFSAGPSDPPPGRGDDDEGEYNRGRVIGLSERALIYLFVLGGHYDAIGFTLAAKAFARSKALDDRGFAEYVLIGTLLSSCMALAIGGLIKWMLVH